MIYARFLAATVSFIATLCLCTATQSVAPNPTLDRDLPEVSITQLESMYAAQRYTVSQVTRWYLQRIARYDSLYKSMLHVDAMGALSTAAAEDAAAARGGRAFKRGALWGIPIVV